MNYFKSIMLTAFALFALAACDTIVNNCGDQAGQTVKHLHFHVLAGRDMTKMDTILGIPCAHTAKTIAAVAQRFQYLGNLSGGFLLFKGCNHTLPLTCLLYTSRTEGRDGCSFSP